MSPSIANAVLERGNGTCEACGATPVELDHFFGRAKAPEAVENIWALCRPCHRAKTDNKPSRESWLERFIEHCEVWKYEHARMKALLLLTWVRAKGSILPLGRKGVA